MIAETHYDGGRNFIAMLKGAKRYVLLPPSECKLLYLYPRGHPEGTSALRCPIASHNTGRHAMADWSQLDVRKYPLMANALFAPDASSTRPCFAAGPRRSCCAQAR